MTSGGYVGLSIATLLSQHHKVMAVDIVPEKVELINSKKSPIQDEYIEKYLAEKELKRFFESEEEFEIIESEWLKVVCDVEAEHKGNIAQGNVFYYPAFTECAQEHLSELKHYMIEMYETLQPFQKCIDDGGSNIPPDREADKDGVILVHVITFSGDGRARGRIAHFDGATGFLIHPVQIGLGIRNFRLNLKNVCTDSICQIFGNFCGDTAGRKIGDKSFAHDNALPLDNFV